MTKRIFKVEFTASPGIFKKFARMTFEFTVSFPYKLAGSCTRLTSIASVVVAVAFITGILSVVIVVTGAAAPTVEEAEAELLELEA
jgi:hypothetical protein